MSWKGEAEEEHAETIFREKATRGAFKKQNIFRAHVSSGLCSKHSQTNLLALIVPQCWELATHQVQYICNLSKSELHSASCISAIQCLVYLVYCTLISFIFSSTFILWTVKWCVVIKDSERDKEEKLFWCSICKHSWMLLLQNINVRYWLCVCCQNKVTDIVIQ